LGASRKKLQRERLKRREQGGGEIEVLKTKKTEVKLKNRKMGKVAQGVVEALS